jgi:hypothetical protein
MTPCKVGARSWVMLGHGLFPPTGYCQPDTTSTLRAVFGADHHLAPRNMLYVFPAPAVPVCAQVRRVAASASSPLPCRSASTSPRIPLSCTQRRWPTGVCAQWPRQRACATSCWVAWQCAGGLRQRAGHTLQRLITRRSAMAVGYNGVQEQGPSGVADSGQWGVERTFGQHMRDWQQQQQQHGAAAGVAAVLQGFASRGVGGIKATS